MLPLKTKYKNITNINDTLKPDMPPVNSVQNNNPVPVTTLTNEELGLDKCHYIYRFLIMNKTGNGNLISKIIGTETALCSFLFFFIELLLILLCFVIILYAPTMLSLEIFIFFPFFLFLYLLKIVTDYNYTKYHYNMYRYVDKEHHEYIKETLKGPVEGWSKVINKFKLDR